MVRHNIGIRYCGGCNPRYDRVAFVRRLEALLPECRFEPMEAGKEYAAVLVVCGCRNQCANTGDITLPAARVITATAFDRLLPVRDGLRELMTETEAGPLSEEALESLLPHKPPMRFLDRVLELVPGERISAEYTMAEASPVFLGHFPERPLLPGTIQTEAMAQAAAVMLRATEDYRASLPILRGLGRANFYRPISPGSTLTIHAVLMARKPEMGAVICKGQIFVEGALASDAELILSMEPIDKEEQNV